MFKQDENNEEKSNIKFNQNINDEEKKLNEIDIVPDIIYGLKPSCYGRGKCNVELKIITVGRVDSEYSPFGRWYCIFCLPDTNKKRINQKEKRKIKDYSISSERTQQETHRWDTVENDGRPIDSKRPPMCVNSGAAALNKWSKAELVNKGTVARRR